MPWLWGNGIGSFWGWDSLQGIGLFAYPNASTYIYSYSNKSVRPGTNLSSGYQFQGTATGTKTNAYFACGTNNATETNTTNIYTYSTNTSVVGPDLTAVAFYANAAGNSILGLFGLGSNNGNTDIWTYSTNSITAGTTLAYGVNQGEATGNAEAGYFSLGLTYHLLIYTYSNNTVNSGTKLPTQIATGAAFGTSSFGIFLGAVYDFSNNTSSNSVNTYIYNYSNNIITAGTSLTTPAGGGPIATGNQNIGVVSIPQFNNTPVTLVTNEYIYASNSVVVGTAFGPTTGTIAYGAAASSQNIGVF